MVPSGIVFVRYLRLPLFILVQAIISQLNGCMFLCSLFLCLLGCCYTVENKIPQTCTFFFHFLKGFMECEGELHWRNKKGYSCIEQTIPASFKQESLFAILDNKLYFWSPIVFSMLTKTLEEPDSQPAMFLLRQCLVAVDVTLEALYFVRVFVLP